MELKQLQINNFKCFSEVDVEFPKGDSTILLLGNNLDTEGMDSNEAGKTSFVEAILWSIFGMPLSVDYQADDIIRHNTKQCHVKIVLEHDNDTIIIDRWKGIKNKLIFVINDVSMNDKTEAPTQVQQTINNYFEIKGTLLEAAKDFSFTNFLTYHSVEKFASKEYKEADRFTLISRIFGLDKWDAYKKEAFNLKKNAKENLDRIDGKVLSLQENIGHIDVKSLEREILDLQEQIDDNEKVLKENKEKKEELLAQEEKSRQKTIYANGIAEYRERIEIAKTRHDKKKTELVLEQKNNNEKIKASQITINDLKGKIKYSLEEISGKINDLEMIIQKNEDVITTKKVGLGVVNSEIENLKNQIDKGLECPKCHANLSLKKNMLSVFDRPKVLKDLKELENKKIGIEQDIQNLNAEITEKNKIITSLSKQKEYVSDLDNEKNSFQNYKNIKKHLDKSLETAEIEYIALIKDLNKTLKTYRDNYEQVKDFESAEIDSITTQITFLEDKKVRLYSKISSNRTLIKEYKNNENTLTEAIKRQVKAKNLYEDYEFWRKAFPEIRRMIIQSILPQIQDQTNSYLKDLQTPFSIILDTVKEAKTSGKKKGAFSINVYDKNNGEITPFYQRSTGARKRIGSSLCYALQDIKINNSNKWMNFRIFDEFLDNIDETGINNTLALFQKIKGQKIITSHNPNLKSKFETVLTITKENGVSTVK